MGFELLIFVIGDTGFCLNALLPHDFMQWGFRRCEDICWVKTNKTNATPGLRHDSHTLFQRSKVCIVCAPTLLIPRHCCYQNKYITYEGEDLSLLSKLNVYFMLLIYVTLYRHNIGTLLDGYKRNCSTQY